MQLVAARWQSFSYQGIISAPGLDTSTHNNKMAKLQLLIVN